MSAGALSVSEPMATTMMMMVFVTATVANSSFIDVISVQDLTVNQITRKAQNPRGHGNTTTTSLVLADTRLSSGEATAREIGGVPKKTSKMP